MFNQIDYKTKQNKTELQHFESKLKRNEWTLNRPSPRNTIKLPLTSPVQQCSYTNCLSVDNAISKSNANAFS